MADRILRDEIWQSERFLDLPTDACRLAFIRLLSSCDDFGNLEGGLKRLFRVFSNCTQIKSEAATGVTLTALMDADLIRFYKIEGRELIHIPRFKSHRQYLARRYPPSPWCDGKVVLGKVKRVTNHGLAKDVVATSLPHSNLVAEGDGVGDGDGVGINTEPSVLVNRSTVPDCPYGAVVNCFNTRLPMLPRVTVVSEARKVAMRSRWREVCAEEHFDSKAGIEWFDGFFERVSHSKFLIGKASNWAATFDWLMKPANFVKVVDGNYERA